ncbi:hypothetical protein [Streptomyces sp. CS62]
MPCPAPEVGRTVHQGAVDAVRAGGAVPFTLPPAARGAYGTPTQAGG